MRRWGKAHDSGLRMRRKHEGWDERAAHMEAELVLVRDLMTREGKADWSANFRREIDRSS
jgi:hypothetical protein